MPWSKVTAGGSATTWSSETGSSASWPSAATSRLTYGWLPYSHVTDAYRGVDFVPQATDLGLFPQPYKASTDRPAVVWNLSVITASGFTAERLP